MARPSVGIVFGGCSEEHSVSVKSAREVALHIDTERWDPVFVGITQGGAWRLCDGPDDGWDRRGCDATLSADRRVHGLAVVEDGRQVARRLDVLFPVVHGRFGEDGAIQGLAELAGIPYVGCDVQSSALCMDKSLAYTVVRSVGIPTPEWRTCSATDDVEPRRYQYPVVVKPARSGSSFGVTRVLRPDDLGRAVTLAGTYDAKVLIESAVAGSEVGCAILGYGDDLIVGELDRISLTGGLFRIHQERDPERGSANATITVPADVSAEIRDGVVATARAIYQALGCSGLARVDMFVTGPGEVVLNEVNTMPGLTSYSRFPRMMEAAGVTLRDVIDRLIVGALAGSR